MATGQAAFTVCIMRAALAAPPGAASLAQIGATGKTFASGAPQCAAHPVTGRQADNGSFLLNVPVHGVSLTQLSATRPRAVVFPQAGAQLVTGANTSFSTDAFARDGGTGQCTL